MGSSDTRETYLIFSNRQARGRRSDIRRIRCFQRLHHAEIKANEILRLTGQNGNPIPNWGTFKS